MSVLAYQCSACGKTSEEVRPRGFRDKQSGCPCGGKKQRIKGPRAETAMVAPVVEIRRGSEVTFNNVAIINAPLGARFTGATVNMTDVFFGTSDAMEVFGDSRINMTDTVHRPNGNTPPQN